MTVTAVLGAGGLGAAIAARLGSQGRRVRLWNRHADKAENVARDAPGVTAVDDVADAVDGADFVVTVLRDADVVAEVLEPVLHRITGVWVQVSTVGPGGAARLGPARQSGFGSRRGVPRRSGVRQHRTRVPGRAGLAGRG